MTPSRRVWRSRLLGMLAAAVIGLVWLGTNACGTTRTAEDQSCQEAIAAATEGFEQTRTLMGLFEVKQELAQEMLHAVNERDQQAIDELQSQVDVIDRRMEAAAGEIGAAERQMKATGCG